jgi:hypothetical protein
MLKYVSKFVSDILPSVIATIIGAYIVNHYIVTKPEAPVAAAVETKKGDDTSTARSDAKSGDAPAETASLPDPGKVKGAPDKSAADKAFDKSADKPTARHQPAPRDKGVAKAATPVTPPVSSTSVNQTPVTTTASIPGTPIEPSPATEERRGATDLARAAIERLRATSEPARPVEVIARAPETSRPQDSLKPPPEAPKVASPIQPLPPAVTIAVPATASVESFNPGVTGSVSSPSNPSYSSNPRNDDLHRPSPPAEIPSRPIDLHADAGTPARSTVAEDVLSAAKSVFHAVLPR